MATPSTSLSIVVLLGGPSAEREVSLRSGAAVAAALRGLGHGVHEVDPTPGSLRIPTETDVAFLALHGTYGEDGTVQTELEALGIPYTGCGIESSRIAFDKVLAKERMIGAGVPTPRYRVLRQGSESWPGEDWTCPVVLKPAREGSSVGLQFVETPGAFSEALQASLCHGTEILMEPRIMGRETTVGILDGVALPVVEVRPKSGAYDYRNKYTPGCTDYLCPAGFPGETTVRIQEAALGAFRAVEARDYARVDVMVTPEAMPMVLEVNTLPGMTETSLLPKAAAAAGISFPELCGRMVELALRRKRS